MLAPIQGLSQKAGVKGVVMDTTAKNPIRYAVVALIDQTDSTLLASTRSAADGKFVLEKIKPGEYTLMVTYPGTADFIMDISLKDTGLLNLGDLQMTSRYHLLQEVIVQSAKAIRMKGDTLEFKADSFAVGPAANVEELLRRLPGIEVGADGKIIAQGEKVTKVLVDGDEFFNDDPLLATRYLKAKSVDKIQVFDKKSDQANFSGIDDGVRSKTINIKLKENSKKGIFGKATLGTDANSSYNDEAMVNLFRNKEKISVFGMGSNTGNTTLSYGDGGNYFSGDGMPNELGISYDYDDDDFEGGGQPTAFNAGAQYANKWKQGKQNLNLSYRLNRLNTVGWQASNSKVLLPDSSIRKNTASGSNSSYKLTHKGGGQVDLVVDSLSTLKLSMSGSITRNSSASQGYSESKDGNDQYLNKSTQANFTQGNSRTFNTALTWQHRFRKKGRTVSVNASQSYTDAESIRNTQALSFYYTLANASPAGDSLNQQQFNRNKTTSLSAKLSYTEPLAKNVYLNLEYGWTQSGRDKDRNVMKPGVGGKYDVPIDSLSNDYTYTVVTNTPGMILQYSNKKFTVNAGGKLGYTSLGQEDRDLHTSSTRSYVNLFPQATLSYQFKTTSRFSLSYNGRTQQPGIDQLQPLKENSDPLNITIGNPNLRPSFTHNLSVNYYSFKMSNGQNLGFSLGMNQVINSIVGMQTVDQFNKTVTQYVNRNGLPGINGNLHFSRRLTKPAAKSSFNMGGNIGVGSYGFLRLLNGTEIKTKSMSAYSSVNFSYYNRNFLSLSYNLRVQFSKSRSDNQNLAETVNRSHSHSINTTIFLPGKIELSTDADMNFQPANSSFSTSRSVVKWNAAITKRLFQGDQGEIKFAMLDILNQNTGYDRSANAGSVYESSRSYIPRYALLSFSWNFTKTL